MLTGPRGLFLIAGQEKVVTVDLERVLTAPPVEHLTVHRVCPDQELQGRRACREALPRLQYGARGCQAGEAPLREGHLRHRRSRRLHLADHSPLLRCLALRLGACHHDRRHHDGDTAHELHPHPLQTSLFQLAWRGCLRQLRALRRLCARPVRASLGSASGPWGPPVSRPLHARLGSPGHSRRP